MRTKRTATFDAITRMLNDGSWHVVEDLNDVTTVPNDWVRELEAEGLVETTQQLGNTLVRLRNPQRIASSA